MYRLLSLMKKHGVLLMVHCENGDILDVRREELAAGHPADISLHPMSRPNEVEHEAVSRMIDMARLLTVPVYIVHTSTRQALEEIEEAKEEGVRGLLRDMSSIPVPDRGKVPSSRFRGGQICLQPAAQKQQGPGSPVEGLKKGIVDTVPRITVPLTTRARRIWAWGTSASYLTDFRVWRTGWSLCIHRLRAMALHTATSPG